MKILLMGAAALVAAAGLTPTPVTSSADAAQTVVRERTVVRHDRGWHGHNRWRTRTVCRREWRHGHRVRICRKVRYRY